MKNIISALLFITLLVSFDLLIPATTKAFQAGQQGTLGTNFWNFGWGNGRTDYFQDGINWNTVENPWRQEFLDDLQIYSVIRFMDQVPTNSSDVRDWNERTLPTENHYTTPGGAVAYEWQIDLCNRLGADMWITVPHLTIESYEENPNSNYWTELAALVKDRLDPGLNIYVEYSNETWSGGPSFSQGDYAGQRGVAMGFDPGFYTAKFYFHVYAAMRLHKVFLDTFSDNPERIKTVVSGQDGSTFGTEQIARAVQNQTLNNGEDTRLNPWNLQTDFYAIANYISSGDGGAANIRNAWSAALAEAVDRYQTHLDIIAPTGMQLISYEGGQHYLTNAHLFAQNPESYDMYMEWLNAVSDYFELTMHYTHVGTWQSGSSWGAKESTDQSINDAHKYRALRDWVLELETGITDIFISNNAVDEGLPAGTSVGVLSTNVPNDEEFNYSLVGGDVESFAIEGNELVTAEVFDYSVKNSYEITVRVVDPEDATNTLDEFFTISVTEVPEGGEVVINPIADTDLQSDPDGTNPEINVSQWNFLFAKFDLTGIADVESAKVRVYFSDQGQGTHNLDIYRVSENWNEDDPEEDLPTGPIWDGSGLVEGETQQVTPGGYVEFDVTSYVQDRISESSPSVSFGFRADVSNWQSYHSRENSENKPELVLNTGESAGPLNPIADTDLQSDPDGTNPEINVSQWNFMFVKFDLPGINQVDAAMMRIFHTPSGGVTNHTLNIYRVSEEWAEDDPEENLPTGPIWDGSGLIAGQAQNVSSEGYVEFDVTPYVNMRLSEGSPTVSFGFRADVPTWQRYFTKENGENIPELVLSSSSLLSVPEEAYLAGETGSGEQNELPFETRLRQNYPNPFNPSTMIRYELPQTSDVRMDVFDLTGRRVATLVDGQVSAGHHQINFDAGSLSSGVYVYRLEAEGVVQTKKMLLVK